MNARQIQTAGEQAICDVCGRTLLRGERAEIYLAGGNRRSVCELCTTRALHEGWVREGTLPDTSSLEGSAERRRSLLGRLKGRREAPVADDGAGVAARSDGARRPPRPRRTEPARRAEPARPVRETAREPRHVRAVPTSAEHRVSSAVDLFNDSEHCRTVAGVARSLGSPVVSVRPSENRGSLVTIAVSWELCWYRYEVDLSDDPPTVRLAGQGYELTDLPAAEQVPNAVADERGAVSLAG